MNREGIPAASEVYMPTYYLAGIVKEDDGSGYSVYFPDVPTVCAGGASVEEAIENATDGLYLAMRGFAEDRLEAPIPSDMNTVIQKVKEERALDNLPYPKDVVYQYIPAPDVNMVPVRVNITVPKSVLVEIDRKAKLAGMSRSGFLVSAAQAYSV